MHLSIPRAIGTVLALTVLLSAPIEGQLTPPEMAIDPSLPVKEGFDVDRAYIGAQPLFDALRNPEFVPLRNALRSGAVQEDTPMLVFERGGQRYGLVTAQMSYHHVAQGDIAGEPWMVTF